MTAHAFRKRLSLMLAILIAFSAYSAAFAVSAQDALFYDDFTSASLSGWSSQSVGKVTNGQYTILYDGVNTVKSVGAKENCAVSADVSVRAVQAANGFKVGGTAYLVARANASMTEGYEFGIGVSKSGSTYVRLYRRSSGKNAQVLHQEAGTVPGLGTIKQDTAYRLKMITAGNRIICYINDVLFADVTDTTYATGRVGLHNLSAQGVFDNFSVQYVPEQKVESITVVNHSKSISRVGKLKFDIKVTYNSVYGTQILNQDSPGVTFSGLDGKTGKKTITVKYGNQTAKFSLTVTDKYQATGLFSDNFTGDLSAYQGGKLENKEYGYTYKFVVKNGMAWAQTPDMKGADAPLKIVANLPEEKTADFDSYTVVADAYIYSDAPTPTKRYGAASIIFAKDKNSGLAYDMRVQSNGMIMIYCGSDLIYSISAQSAGISTSMGEKIAMRAHVYLDYVEFYCNGKKVYTYYGYSRENSTPYIGFSAIGGTVAFDRFAGTTLEVKGDYAIQSLAVVTLEGGTVKTVTSNGLDLSSAVIKITYIDGSIGYAQIKSSMVSGYNSDVKGDQNITVTYAGKKTSFLYRYVPYLFNDDFDSGINAKWKFSTSAGMSTSVVNNRLKFSYTPTGDVNASVNATVTGGEEWTDYAVSADVFFDSRANTNGKVRYAGIMARHNGKDSWYEFRLSCNNGVITGALYRFDKSGANILQNYATTMLRKSLAEKKTLGTGVLYNLRLEVYGNTIKTYLDDVLLAVYVDDSPAALLSGTAGIRNITNTAYYDNFIVRKRTSNIAQLRLSGTTGDSIELYTGFDIELWNYMLEVVYQDGTIDSVMLRADMISDYDNTVVGKQKVTLSYLGYTYPLSLMYKERPEHIKSLEKAIDSFKGIQGTDTEKFYALKEKFDTLSPYEASKLSKSAVTKYKKYYEQLERNVFSEIKDTSLLLFDDFNSDTAGNWKESIEGDAAKWFMCNSLFYQAQRPFNRYVNGWRSPDVYGELTSISADCQMLSNDMYMGIAINIGENGYYHTRLSNKTRDDDDNVIYTLQLYKKTSEGHSLVNSILTEVNGIRIERGQWFNLRLTVQGNVVSAYINDTLMLTYEDSGKVFHSGECGLRISEGDALFDNVRVYGTALERDNTTVQIEPTEYNDDFEDEKIGGSPSHWQENYVADKVIDYWKLYKKDSVVYGTENSSGATATWLHVFDNDPQISMKFMVGNSGTASKIGFITRRSPDTAFVNIGYDFSQKKWFVAAQESEAAGTVTTYAEKASALKSNQWYTVEIKENGGTVTVTLDGKEVVRAEDVRRTGYGRVGAFTENAAMYIDDVHCTFAGGDIPMDGLTSYVVIPDEYAGYMEIESLDDGKTLVGVSATSRQISYDAGRTWKNVTQDKTYSKICSTSGGYSSILKLKSGKYLQINLSTDAMAEVSDDLKTWKTAGRIVPLEDQVNESGIRRVIIHVNTPTEYKLNNGTCRIFCPIVFRRYNASGSTILGHYTQIYYSDDGGYTWNRSETTTKDILPGYSDEGGTTWAESKIIKCSDGTLRMYYSRNYLGCMQYTVSKDNGITWEGLYQIPEMQCAMTSFSVIEDPTEEGTYYMLWVNGKARYLGSVYPRNRICLVKSTDGMNWKFVMNCERMTDYISVQNGEELYQILDPALYVTKDYVYITFGRSEREFSKDDAYSHQAQRCYYIRAEKDKLTTRAWDASTIADMRYPKTIAFETMPQQKFGMSDLFNTIGTLKLTDFLGNTNIEDISENCTVYEEPNMFKLGEQNVRLIYKNGTALNYTIQIVPNYNIVWNISGGGTVDPEMNRIMEDEDQTFKLIPDNGYKIQSVFINGAKASVRGKTFAVEKVKENLTIDVTFVPKTILDYLVWIVPVVLLIGAAVVGYILYSKKHPGEANKISGFFKRLAKKIKNSLGRVKK